MDSIAYKELTDKITNEIKTSVDADAACAWSKCLKNCAIAMAVDTDQELKLKRQA